MMRYSVQWQDACGEWVHYSAHATQASAEEAARSLSAVRDDTVRVMGIRGEGLRTEWEQVYIVRKGGVI